MNRESLEMAIEDAKKSLEGRNVKKNLSWLLTTAVMFLVPIFYFYGQEESVYRTAYAPLVVGWLMITVWIGNVVSRTLVGGKTIELILAIETSTALLELVKERESSE